VNASDKTSESTDFVEQLLQKGDTTGKNPMSSSLGEAKL
jgi:hypothetical protein